MKSNSLKRRIGLTSAVALGISSIIGSGWLFAPFKTAVVAGPAAIASWIVGGLIVCLLGLLFAEIATLYPRRGLSAIIPVLSHNRYFAFPFAIANWLGIVAVVGLEADATIQYLINLTPTIEPYLYHNSQLTMMGDSLSIILVIGFCIINYWGASTLVKTNNIFAVIKVIIPIFVIVILVGTAFHPHNFVAINHTLVPYGYESIFSALLTTGIIVAFNGFQTVISFASEIEKPNVTIPLSVVIAVLFCTVVYLILQVAYIGAMPQDLLASGWKGLQFNAPIVQLLGLLGLGMFSTVIYFGATMSPSGTAIAFTGTASRMFTAMSRNGQMPKYFDAVHPVYNISRRSLLMNTGLTIIFLLLFRSWGSLAQVLSIFHVISYLPVPIAIWVFRGRIEKEKYPFRMPFGKTIALFVFLFFTYIFTLADLKIATEVMIFFAFFMLLFILLNCRTFKDFVEVGSQSWTMGLYFVSLLLFIVISPSHSHYLTNLEYLVIFTVSNIALFICLVKGKKDDLTAVESVDTLSDTDIVEAH